MICSRCGAWAPDGQTACAHCGAPLAAGAAAAYAAAGVEPDALPRSAYAGFWRRLWGCVVDALVLFFPGATVRVLLGLPAWTWQDDTGDSRPLLAFVVQSLLAWLYAAWLVSSRRRGTLGQQLLGLEVNGPRGARVGFARATARHFAQYLSVLTLGAGYLLNLVSRRRQTLHDLLAGCVVVRAGHAVMAAPLAPAAPPAPAAAPGGGA
ncbi:MAG TPA: RDD family protein [Candidatus Eisenbacteria bacterium]|nr:RDD family protein [Candidatus Eisenbacteria bacterium]